MLLRLMVVALLMLIPVTTPLAQEKTVPVEQGGDTLQVNASNAEATNGVDQTWEDTADSFSQEEVSDPLEPFNRAMFVLNDLFYSVIIKPVALIYATVTPEIFRSAIRNFFHNLAMPKHFLNALLQGKPNVAGMEVFRFAINTSVGVLGFYDAAQNMFDIKSGNEDTGQTFGTYGIGDSVYINWPIFGPSNLRDSIGLVGDTFLDPLSYVPNDIWVRAGIQSFRYENEVSLKMGEYDNLKKAALDPYISVRDAYRQTRRKQIKE
ncbi:MAG: VacJ family lipoprotein [Magnetococcales bacterium]|nr:VacJ family lipoprotein [Magnetococcales bacterium]